MPTSREALPSMCASVGRFVPREGFGDAESVRGEGLVPELG